MLTSYVTTVDSSWNQHSYDIIKLQTLLEFHHFFPHKCPFSFEDPTHDDPILHLVVISPSSFPVLNDSSVFACISWPWHVRRVLNSYSVECPSVWVCLMFFTASIFSKNTAKMTLRPQCLTSRGVWRQHVLLPVMFSLAAWLSWRLLVSLLQSYHLPFAVNKYFRGNVLRLCKSCSSKAAH